MREAAERGVAIIPFMAEGWGRRKHCVRIPAQLVRVRALKRSEFRDGVLIRLPHLMN